MLNRRQRLFAANNGGAFQIPRAGLALAVDAALGVTASGGFASQWSDLSGNARHLLQATGANQPIHLPFVGAKYGWLPGVAGNYFSTPDSVANSITGDIDIRVKAALTDWTPSANSALVAKRNGVGAYLLVILSNGLVELDWWDSGGVNQFAASTAVTGIVDGAVSFVRATLDVDNGAGGCDVRFYKSSDGVTWTQIGTTVTQAFTTSIRDTTDTIDVGSQIGGAVSNLSGTIYSAQIYNGIDGTLAVDFDPSRWTSGTTFTASTGETWTINSTGSKPAQIVDRPSLLFDGAAHFMKTAAFTLNQPETVYLVAKQHTWVNGNYFFDGNTINSGMVQDVTASPQIRSNAGASLAAINGPAIGSVGVITAIFNGANSLLQTNNETAGTGDAGASNMGGFTLGASGTPSFYGNIQAYEALIYNVAHDAATRANVIRALMSKHGVA